MNKIVSNIEDFILQNKIKRIFLDVDGVILHSCQAMCDIMNEWCGTDFVGSDILSWNFKEINPNLTDRDIDILFDSDLFFDYVELIDGVREFIKCHENNVVIVTHSNPNNFIQKTMLFALNDLNVPIIPIPLNQSKSLINMQNGLFIDDNTNNLNESNAKYKIQFREYNDGKERDWQQGWNGLIMYNWKER